MSDLLTVYDLDLQKTAVLQNLISIQETHELNDIYTLVFEMPADDPKAKYCNPFHYVRFGSGELYRIVQIQYKNNDKSVMTVNCEHVIATLCDNVLFGSYIYNQYLDGTSGNTRNAIQWILSHQAKKNWVLSECDFDYLYEYSWEQENLLNSLYSIPKEFLEPYIWTFNTSIYPWRLSLKKIPVNGPPAYYIQAKKNLIDNDVSMDYADICTRLYPLGYGEGVNQLTIREENNNIPYLDASPEMISKYGLKEKILVDRSFENAVSLKAYAQIVLNGYQSPGTSRKFNVTDLYPLTSRDIDKAEVGKICMMTEDNTLAYITKTIRHLDKPGDLQIELSTSTTDVIQQVADLADRVRIESVYAQGATQVYQHSKDANAGSTLSEGHVLSLYFPSEMKQINKVLLNIRLKRFRMYSKSTESGGGSTETSSEGGKSSQTSSSGGGTYGSSTGSAGATIEGSIDAAWNGGDMAVYTSVPQSTDYDYHTHAIDRVKDFKHTHTFTLSAASHSHSINIDAHTHTVEIPSHQHSVNIPSHKHDISPGIYEASSSASGFSIYVGNDFKTSITNTSWDGDITEWLLNDSGMIPRNSWIDVTIVPNALAYVVSSVFIQGFVQSRGGGNY